MRRLSSGNRRYDCRVATAEALKALLGRAFPEATELEVADRTGGGDHFRVALTTSRFNGLSRIDQHRLVYAAVAELLGDGSIHELRIRTRGTE